MCCHEAIKLLREGRKQGDLLINPERPLVPCCQATKDGLGPAEDLAIRLDQMHRFQQFAPECFRESLPKTGILQWKVFYFLASGLPPASHPATAEVTICIVNQDRLLGPFCHNCNRTHRTPRYSTSA